MEERAELAEVYLSLLASSIPPTVTFALDALRILNRAGRLDAAQFVRHLPPVLLARHKGTVIGVAKLLEEMAKREPALRRAILLTAAEGVVTESAEAQGRLAQLFLQYPEAIDAPIRAALDRAQDTLSPSARQLLAKVTPGLSPAAAAIAENEESPLAEIAEAALPLEPIASVEELLERAGYVLEHPDDLEEFERVLAGLVRFAAAGGEALGKEAKPLNKRAAKLAHYDPKQWYDLDQVTFRMHALVIQAWADPGLRRALPDQLPRENPLPEYTQFKDHEIHRFHFARLIGILRQLLAQTGAPLLSTPTHTGFWIDPRVFVQRLAILENAKAAPNAEDAVIGFLRLAHEHRQEALHAAAKLAGEIGAAARYALGGEENIGARPWLWIAASRALYRGEADAALEAHRPHLGPGAARLPTDTLTEGAWETKMDPHEMNLADGKMYEWTSRNIRRALELPASMEIPRLHFTVMLHSRHHFFDRRDDDGGWHSWYGFSAPWCVWAPCIACWPAWREPVYGMAVLALGNNTASMEVDDLPVLRLFATLTEPAARFGENALLLVNFGLSCPHADGRAGAVSAFIAGVETRRLDPRALGRAMLLFFSTGLIFPARVRKSLDEVVRVSPRHRRAVMLYLLTLLEGDAARPAAFGGMLELLRELLIEHHEKVREEKARAYLAGLTGGGVMPKLAKALLAL